MSVSYATTHEGSHTALTSTRSELNLLRLPFFRNGNDPLEDFDYNDPRCNPLLRPAAARTPSHTTAHQPASCVCLTHFFTASVRKETLLYCLSAKDYIHFFNVSVRKTTQTSLTSQCERQLGRAGSKNSPATSKSGINSYDDSRPSAQLRKEGDNFAGRGHEKTDFEQAERMSGDYRHVENPGCDTDHGGLNEIAFTIAQDEQEGPIGGCPEGETFKIVNWVDNNDRAEKETDNVEGAIVIQSGHELPAQLTMTYTGQGVFAPIQIREINWALTTLTDRISSLDVMYTRMREDTNLARHHITQLRNQLTSAVDELEIKIDVLEATLSHLNRAYYVGRRNQIGAQSNWSRENQLRALKTNQQRESGQAGSGYQDVLVLRTNHFRTLRCADRPAEYKVLPIPAQRWLAR
ncbi:RNA-binding protein [Dorcoceras hygrometricum]|uniref:RNA-binding protein n=1 Tax=Dorcoceras hygrometricum TaxID=472368 RepID=A0A2Z7CXT6_9LAMI|nr:RNA-binding protein [Dorcoceras hygrometricum]